MDRTGGGDEMDVVVVASKSFASGEEEERQALAEGFDWWISTGANGWPSAYSLPQVLEVRHAKNSDICRNSDMPSTCV